MKRWSNFLMLLATAVLCGCGASRSVAPAPELTIDPLSLYPLRAGNAWSYDVDTGDADTTLAVTRVESVHGPIVTMRTGETEVRYELREHGVYVISDDAWLFRAPFEEGATWPARGGRTGRVVTTMAAVETPAGRFRGCLEVSETGGRLGLVVTTIYCPFIGPVSVDSTMPSSVSDRTASVRARLRGYDVDPVSITP